MATILAIDDEPVLLKYLSTIITQSGYSVRTASDGLSGYDAAIERDIDLIISDLNMPGNISGMNLIKKLRESRPDCPIVILTGYPNANRMEEAENLNVEFLTKPFEIPFLIDILNRLLPLNSKQGLPSVPPKQVSL